MLTSYEMHDHATEPLGVHYLVLLKVLHVIHHTNKQQEDLKWLNKHMDACIAIMIDSIIIYIS